MPELPNESKTETPEEDAPLSEEIFPEEEEKPAPGKALRIVGGVVLAAGLLCGAYFLSFLPRRAARRHKDVNRSVIHAYRRYRRAVDLGSKEDKILEELGRKAKFSQHTLTEEERETAWTHLDAAAESARGCQPKWRRFLFPLAKPLL